MPPEAAQQQQLSDPQKLQLVVGNCIQKATELILHGRLMPLPATLRRGGVNRWFNIESEELLTVHDELEAWRQDISQPLQIDVYVDAGGEPLIRSALGLQPEEPTTVLLERWRLRYEPLGAPPSSISWPAFYKRFMVLLRSLLAQLRLLPTFRLAANLARLRGNSNAADASDRQGGDGGGGGEAPLLQYCISLPRAPNRPAPAGLGFAIGANEFSFPRPDSQHGKLDIGVLYRPLAVSAGRSASPFTSASVTALAGGEGGGGAAGGGGRGGAGGDVGIRGGVAAIGSSAAGDCHLAGGVSPTGARATTVIVGGLGAALIPDYVGTPEAAAQRRPSLATRNLAAAAGGGSGVGLAGAPGSRGRRYSEAQVAAMTAGLTQLTAEHPPRPSPSPTPTAASSSSHHQQQQQQQQAQADEPARLRAATVSGVSPHGSPSMAAASQQQQQQQQPPLPHSSPLPAVVSEQHATQHAMPPPSQAPPLAPGGSAAGSSSRRRSQSDAATYAAEVRAMAMGVGGIPTDEAVGGSVGSVGFGLLGTSPPIPLPAGRAAATGRATAPPMFLAGSPPVTALGSSPHAAGRLSPSAAAASTSALPPHHPMPSSSAASSSQAPLHFAAQPLSSSPSSALAAALQTERRALRRRHRGAAAQPDLNRRVRGLAA